MPWNPARLVLENDSEALRQSLYRRSGIAIPEALIGVLQSLDELDVDQMIAGNSDELSWLAIEKPQGLLLFTWTGENQITVNSSSLPLRMIDDTTITWDPEWVRRIQLRASQTELYNINRAVDLAISFSQPAGPTEIQRLAVTISGSMVLDNHHQAVEWVLRLQNRLTGEIQEETG